MADFRPEMADFKPERADFRAKRADFRPERADYRTERADFRGLMGGQMDGRTEGRTDKRKSPCVLQDIVPFGAAALLPITYIPCLQKQLQPAKDVLCENYAHHIIRICSIL